MSVQEYLRPIVTPFELQMALGVVATWDGRYSLDFGKVLEENHVEPTQNTPSDEDEPEFSLITGKYRQVKNYSDLQAESNAATTEGALVQRNQEGTVAKMASAASK